MRVPAFITRERTLQKDGNCYNYLWVVPINVRGSDKSMRIFKVISVKFFAALLALSLLTGPSALFAAASSSKQLAKGIELYNAENYDDAMDYFIDVLVNGSRSEVDEANRYIFYSCWDKVLDSGLNTLDPYFAEKAIMLLAKYCHRSGLPQQCCVDRASSLALRMNSLHSAMV